MSSIETEDSQHEDQSCAIGKLTLFYDNFSQGFNPTDTSSPYILFGVPGVFVANDGTTSITNGELTINSSPFTFSGPGPVDHVKYLAALKDAFNVPVNGEIVYEGIMSAQQTGLSNVPTLLQATGGSLSGVSNANSDLRLANGNFLFADLTTHIIGGFFLTNEDIYVNYSLGPEGMTAFGGTMPNYHGFSANVPVAKRNTANPLSDYVKLAIAYNYRLNTLRWLINDVEVYRVDRLGFPLERKYNFLDFNGIGANAFPSELIRPKQFLPAFGTSNSMDGYNPQNPGQVPNVGLVNLGTPYEVDPIVTSPLGDGVPASFITSYPLTSDGTNFGQGAIIKIKYIAVYLLAPEKELRSFPDLCCYKKKELISRCVQNSIPGVNSANSLYHTKCKGCIKNCDNCEQSQVLDCSCAACKKKPVTKILHKCDCYEPHTYPVKTTKSRNECLQRLL